MIADGLRPRGTSCQLLLTLSQIFFTLRRMSFREKSAWISFGCLLAVGGFWFRNIVRVELYHVRQANPMLAFLSLLGALILAEIALHLVIALRDPKEARTPKDEREKLIDLKAARVGFYVLMTGAWLSIA